MITTDKRKKTEKVFLLFALYDKTDISTRIEELSSLVKTAGAEVVGSEYQFIREVCPATIFGKGKLEQFKIEIREENVDTVIFDGTLSPSKTQNLSDILDIKVIDRTTLILDIFAINATTAEGKLQVELAQLEYLLPRLKGQGKALSRLGGGIGTRGPGETRLETNKRYIRNRINSLKNSLKDLENRRNAVGERRKKNGAIVVALAGYTNAGKSTLLNLLSGSDVIAEDKLFATLDPTARKVKIGDFNVIFVDTVGFIRDIPTSLIEAFRSTLQSVENADVVLNVCDVSSSNLSEQAEVANNEIIRIKPTAKIIKVYNKADKISYFEFLPTDGIIISAKQNKGIDVLVAAIKKEIESQFEQIKIIVPHEQIGEFYKLTQFLENYKIDYGDDGAEISFTIRKSVYPKIRESIKNIRVN